MTGRSRAVSRHAARAAASAWVALLLVLGGAEPAASAPVAEPAAESATTLAPECEGEPAPASGAPRRTLRPARTVHVRTTYTALLLRPATRASHPRPPWPGHPSITPAPAPDCAAARARHTALRC
ncbi:hypothetical protein ACFQVC_06270 [Streptomyces monticola]|uniref:Secreted protein n=1 Tax=Streptomyces monticola TaxID=2666263 RepID=A0ABW2JCT6_9ACTN